MGMDAQMLAVSAGNDAEPSAADSALYRDGRVLWSYTVPQGNTLTLKDLVHAPMHAAQAGNLPNGTQAAIDGGVIKIQKNGTDVYENRIIPPNIYGPTPPGTSAEGGITVVCAVITMGKTGITFVGNTDTLAVVVTPGVDDAGVGYFVTVNGKRAGVPDVQTGFAMPTGPSALTTIFSYLPATDYVVVSITVSAICIGSVVYSQLRMEIDGQTVFICGKWCVSQRTLCTDPLWFPLWGIKLMSGQTIRLIGHIVLNARHYLSTQMAGKLDPITSGPIVGRAGSIARTE
jgi:hypothetical protein